MTVTRPQGDRNTVLVAAGAASTSLFGRFAGRAMTLVTQIVVARILGPASYGLYSIGLATLKVLGLISQLGMERGVVRIGAKYLGRDDSRFRAVLLQAITIPLLLGALLGVGTYLLAPWVARNLLAMPDSARVLRWFCPAFGLFAGMRVASFATTLSQDMKYMVRAQELVQPGLELVVVGAGYILGWGLAGPILAVVFSLATAFVVAVVDLVRLFSITMDKMKQIRLGGTGLISYSLSLTVGSTLLVLLQWVDRYLVASFLPASEVGIYQAAGQGSIVFVVILSALNSAFTPLIADLSERKSYSQLEALYRVVTKWGLYISLPIYIVILLMPTDLMTFVYGSRYAAGSLPLVILATGQLVNLTTGAVGLLLVMNRQVIRWTAITGVMLITNVTLGLLLIPRFGLAGAALSSAVAVAGQFGWGLSAVRRHLGIVPYDRRYLKGLAAGFGSVVCVGLVSTTLQVGPFIRLALSGVLSVAVFGAILWVLGLDEEDHAMIVVLWERIRRSSGPNGQGP